MTNATAMQTFVDDELLRAPLVMEAALSGASQALQKGPGLMGASERSVASDIIQRLGTHRPRVIDRYVASLREQVNAELAREAMVARGRSVGTTASLALVDDDEVSIDVVISHTIEAIKSVAEYELRELITFTSALAGDMDVGADHNPFRAETHAQALWAAAQALPLTRGHQLAFMRHTTMPLAQALRKGYAAACVRLEGEGLEPAAYRTVIPPAGPRTTRTLDRDLAEAIPSMVTVNLGGTPVSASGVITAAASASGYEQKILALIGRLFEAMNNDRRLPRGMPAALARIQPFAVKAALDHPDMLEQATHPLWRFLDLLAHLALVDRGPDAQAREKLLRFASKLIDQLTDEPRHTPQLYGWAIERLERFAANRLSERCTLAQAHIATMHELEDRLVRADASVSSMHGTLDVAQLDTVPADLLDLPQASDTASNSSATRWLADLRAGLWLRMFRKGGWVHSQLLWPGERGEIWLFADGDSDDSWAIRRSALTVLRKEGLSHVLLPRSLLSDASERLLRRATTF